MKRIDSEIIVSAPRFQFKNFRDYWSYCFFKKDLIVVFQYTIFILVVAYIMGEIKLSFSKSKAFSPIESSMVGSILFFILFLIISFFSRRRKWNTEIHLNHDSIIEFRKTKTVKYNKNYFQILDYRDDRFINLLVKNGVRFEILCTTNEEAKIAADYISQNFSNISIHKVN